MANFSSFFPVAASGGGGFTKMKKYSTAQSTAESTNRLNGLRNNSGSLVTDNSAGTLFNLIYDQPAQSIAAAPSTYTINNLRFDSSTALNVGAVIPANFFAGGTVRFSYSGVNNINLQQPSLISSHPEFTYADSNSSLVLSYSTNPQGAFSASARTNLGTGDTIPLVVASTFTVNPATDLGLSDGDSIGFLLAGGNITGVLRGTAIISNASTDLVITPGLASGTASTITGGLTLTSADGSKDSSYPKASVSLSNGYQRHGSSGGNGIDGYGTASQYYNTTSQHGYGAAGKDGAVLLFY